MTAPLRQGKASARLARETDAREAAELAGGLIRLAMTTEDKRQARDALLRLLADQTRDWLATPLATGVAQLDPTIHDLSTWRAWAAPPTAELLAAARQNSALADWIAALSPLATLSS